MTASDGLATEVVRALDAAGVKVSEIAVRSASLDDVFLTLTGHKAEDKTTKTEQTGRSRPMTALDAGPGRSPARPRHAARSSSSSATSGC